MSALLYTMSGEVLQKTDTPVPAPSLQSLRVIPWFKDNGDKTHRVNYELNENSIVMDLGGYEGQWAADIFCRYACIIHIFEPYPEYAKKIEDRFKNNPRVSIYNYGLAKSASVENLYISADSSSTHKASGDAVEVQLKEINAFFTGYNINKVDLMKINIEGGEYDLLEYLILSNLIKKFDNIQVQFHDFVPGAKERMNAIQIEMSKTHYLTYQYEFVWENWKIKAG